MGTLVSRLAGNFTNPPGILEWETKQAECHCSRATRREHLHCGWQRPVGCRKGPRAHQEAVGSGGRVRREPSMAPVLLPSASSQARPSAPFRYLLLHCIVKLFKLKVQRIEQAHTSFTQINQFLRFCHMCFIFSLSTYIQVQFLHHSQISCQYMMLYP